jgi:hypothetical protein
MAKARRSPYHQVEAINSGLNPGDKIAVEDGQKSWPGRDKSKSLNLYNTSV